MSGIAALLALACLITAFAASPPAIDPAQLKALQARKALKVLVTDSGLGGLSVCADLETKALAHKAFQSVEIIFCNALPEANYGYNNLATPQRKAKIFSDALNGMVEGYDPDIVLIACNTLSVIYPDTDISRTLKVPVVGIVDLGVAMICEKMLKNPDTPAVIFGTETTISANTHKRKCVAQGIPSARIITQLCSALADEIQSAPQGDAARNLIEMYVGEAVNHLPQTNGKVIVALCCTHYGYCADVFSQAFAAAGKRNIDILNPNDRMADLLFTPAAENRFHDPQVTVKVVSRALLSPDEIHSIGALLEKASPKTGQALRQYERKEDLFPFDHD